MALPLRLARAVISKTVMGDDFEHGFGHAGRISEREVS